ncbi:MAG: M15 family metallopeptidase [Clostridia bacterium]|nr:M15 family metallopeptidase [Clostridia bacterium]
MISNAKTIIPILLILVLCTAFGGCLPGKANTNAPALGRDVTRADIETTTREAPTEYESAAESEIATQQTEPVYAPETTDAASETGSAAGTTDPSTETGEEPGTEEETEKETEKETEQVRTVTEIDYLVLVNRKNRLPDNWDDVIELEYAESAYGEPYYVEKKTLRAFKNLRQDLLENDGIDIEMNSTYRSVARQQEIWDRFAEEKGRSYAERYVAVPGYSEHHTGLAIDVIVSRDGVLYGSNEEMIAARKTFAVIHAKLADYGFILRYPEGKETITGYAYEPWHFRYVGPDAAKEIAARGITLEEYRRNIPDAVTALE